MTKVATLLFAVVVAGVVSTVHPGPPRPKIGTFDSRAIAIAYANSAEGSQFINGLRAEMAKARESRNDSLVRAVSEKGRVHQVLMHLQGFSVGSVSEILKKHAPEMKEVARAAGVEALVSKFELAYLGNGIDTVDVTLPMVKLFDPSERALVWVADLAHQPPLPMFDILAMPAEE